MTNYTIKRSDRKTLSITVNKDAAVIVHAPLYTDNDEIKRFIEKNREWLKENITKTKRKNNEIFNIPKERLPEMKREALVYITERVNRYCEIMGVRHTGIKITTAKTRLGSCNGKNSLCFSVYLLNYPKEAVEYVVLHELVHIKHKNHGKAFYSRLQKYMPDYKERIKIIKGI